MRLLTTVPHEFTSLTPSRLAWWRKHADVINRRDYSRLGYVLAVRQATRRSDAVLLDGSIGAGELYSDLLIAGAIRRRARRIVISDATWKRGRLLDRTLMAAGLRAIDSPRTIYCVLSSDELASFPHTWHVDRSRVVFTPFCHTLTDAELASPVSDDGGVFAGGDSMRNYDLLLDATKTLPAPVMIASGALAGRDLPDNVTARSVTHDEFIRLMCRTSVVVVPLHTAERSAGQQTYLNAMALGKLVVVSDAPGVRDYIQDRVTGLIVTPNDAQAFRLAVNWGLDHRNAEEVDAIRLRARALARTQFSPDAYFQRLLNVAQDA